MPATPPARPAAATANAVRHFGRFQLLRLLGKSVRSMVWLVNDPRVDQELVLVMPRTQLVDGAALAQWRQAARRGARIDHPGLAHVVELGDHERWPFITYDRGNTVTLAERLGRKGLAAAEVVPWAAQVLQGLAFAHEGGVAHGDLQPHLLMLNEMGACRLMGLGVVQAAGEQAGDAALANLQLHRQSAERDVLSLGLVLHQALAGQAPLDQPDISLAAERLPPRGRELVRLPWDTANAIPEALRAIVNRATDRQERQRYRTARTFARALDGWLQVEGGQGAGPMALLLDRIRQVGLLPATPGGAARAARLASMERERTIELAEIVLSDAALAFELLRMVNTAQVRHAMATGNGPILTIRRAIAMVGLEGVRRGSLALRPWPGPLGDEQAAELELLVARVHRAARIAQWLRPPGYDAEVVYLLTMLQNLGRLLVQYHFPDDATQIRRLMQPAAAAKPDEPDEPGMSEEGASFAVLGVDSEVLGHAVGRHWGLDDSVLHMMRRVPIAAPVRTGESDDGVLRLTASCANELVDLHGLPAAQQAAAMQRVAQRYGRALGVSLRDLQLAAQGIAPGQAEDAAHEGSA